MSIAKRSKAKLWMEEKKTLTIRICFMTIKTPLLFPDLLLISMMNDENVREPKKVFASSLLECARIVINHCHTPFVEVLACDAADTLCLLCDILLERTLALNHLNKLWTCMNGWRKKTKRHLHKARSALASVEKSNERIMQKNRKRWRRLKHLFMTKIDIVILCETCMDMPKRSKISQTNNEHSR